LEKSELFHSGSTFDDELASDAALLRAVKSDFPVTAVAETLIAFKFGARL
jgi:hypothetical protein